MDLSENRNQHPNLITQSTLSHCQTANQTYTQSVVVPWDAPIQEVAIQSVMELSQSLIETLCAYEPEIIVLATGEQIEYPAPEVLTPLVEQHIGLEVMTNQAAARTFNVLMAEDRRVVCLFLINSGQSN